MMMSRAVLGTALVVALPACGGGSSTSPSTPQSATSVVAQGSGSIGRAEVIKAIPFTTSASGRVDVTVDWTFTTSLLQVSVYRGRCTAAELLALNCSIPVVTSNPPKPIRISLNDASAGAYTIGIINASLTDESYSYQVTLTR
jgi:hypothetical protein